MEDNYLEVNSDGSINVVAGSDLEAATAAGLSFLGTSDYTSTGVATEANLLLIRVPSGSTRQAQLTRLTFSSPQNGGTIYRVYLDPTITTNGTALPSVCAKQVSPGTAQALLTRTPVTTARGTLFYAAGLSVGSVLALDLHQSLWVQPGHSILVTANQSLIGGAAGVSVEWVEA